MDRYWKSGLNADPHHESITRGFIETQLANGGFTYECDALYYLDEYRMNEFYFEKESPWVKKYMDYKMLTRYRNARLIFETSEDVDNDMSRLLKLCSWNGVKDMGVIDADKVINRISQNADLIRRELEIAADLSPQELLYLIAKRMEDQIGFTIKIQDDQVSLRLMTFVSCGQI